METQKVLWIGGAAAPTIGGPLTPSTWRIERLPPTSALERLPRAGYDAVVLEFPILDWTPEKLLVESQRLAPGTPVLICDPGATLSDAVRLSRLGACDFLDPSRHALPVIAQAIEKSRGASGYAGCRGEAEEWRKLLIGNSNAINQVCQIIRMVASRRATVLITGETGAGKEMVARALHLAGCRARAPFVALNCSALPEHLLEDELFGHVRGAFTGAFQNRVGRFEQAHGGVLFLDEIGDLPFELQAKLLRVLQEREFQKLGSSESIRADVRVIAAANCDLLQRIAAGKFREDLFYRLNVVPIHLAPLRQRREDIQLLATHFAAKICRAESIRVKQISEGALASLSGYGWPGNVRQLENAVEMAVAMSGDRPVLTAADFPLPQIPVANSASLDVPPINIPETGLDYEETLAVIERSILEQALQRTGGNKKAAADMLKLKRTTLSAKVRSLESAACN